MTSTSNKIIPFEKARATFEALKAQGQKIVQSHGVYDLTLPGHILHLEEAKRLGDVLVVSISADKHVNKGPGRPYFKEQLRAQTVAALASVDYVVIVPFTGAIDAIKAIQPAIYCKGKDYEGRDEKQDPDLQHELKAAGSLGAQIAFVGPLTFSSTKILNQNFDHLSPAVKEFCMALSADYSARSFRELVDGFGELKVLVIGDTIFDRYSYVKVQGLTSKNRIISGRFVSEETQCGGALAVYRHVQQFTPHVKFLSLVGTESWVDPLLREHIEPNNDLVIRDKSFTTIIKQRYVEPFVEGKELSKLFSVNFIDRDPPAAAVQKKVEESIRAQIAWADVVLLTDFGHGMMQPQIRRMIEQTAPFLALNCQTNSNNHGFNIISRQYQRADAFTLDEQELMLSSGQRQLDFPVELKSLQKTLQSKYGWLTRGPSLTIGICGNNPPATCPPLEHEIIDSIGAGDAFFSVAALAAARGVPIQCATFIGQLAGAQAVKIIGNTRPITKEQLLRTATSLLNF